MCGMFVECLRSVPKFTKKLDKTYKISDYREISRLDRNTDSTDLSVSIKIEKRIGQLGF